MVRHSAAERLFAESEALAIYHASTKSLSRSDGRSAVASVAYRAGERLEDARTGLVHDYSRRSGVMVAEILTPDGGGADRSALWNAAEAAEKRKDSRTAREWVLALPAELEASERHELARAFAAQLVERYGVAADLAIHAPSREGDDRNHHAHIFLTTRRIERDGSGALAMGEKAAMELSDSKRRGLGLKAVAEEVKELRRIWEELANAALERAGRAERIDRRSLEAQGIDREPTQHMGPEATQMERRKEGSERGEVNRQVSARNEARAAEIVNLEAERQRRAQEVQEERARAAREAEATRAAEAAQKAAQEATEALQERERRQREAEARKAQEEAQRAAEAEAKRKAAEDQARQAENARRAKQQAERERVEAMTAQELAQEIERLRLPPPEQMQDRSRDVQEKIQASRLAYGIVKGAEGRERSAREDALTWRRQHRLLAWAHDKGWLQSSKLIAYGRQEEEARLQAAEYRPRLQEAEIAEGLAIQRVKDRWFAVTSHVMVLRDIRERKLAEEAAEARREAQERERAAAEQTRKAEADRKFVALLRADPKAVDRWRSKLSEELEGASGWPERETARKRLEKFEKLAEQAARPKEPERRPTQRSGWDRDR